MTLSQLNTLPPALLREELQKCCGSSIWVQAMLASLPFASPEDLLGKADQAWAKTSEQDWLEAFSHHPKIGDLESLENKFASTKAMAGKEQAAVTTATRETLQELAKGNADYEQKFGFIFIVFASGKSAGEMLHILKTRIQNDRTTELKTAAAEQHKITRLRLQSLLG